jgi:hypothetical protein
MIDVGQMFQNFEAARLYYLHDKREENEAERFTTERIARVETRNLPTEDPHNAFKVMAFTAINADDIKRQHAEARGEAYRPGKPIKTPGFSLTLSWHPDDAPEDKHIMETGDAAIAALDHIPQKDKQNQDRNLSHRQRVMVIHRDQDHVHLHILINMVHPETGKVQHPRRDLRTGRSAHELTNYKLVLSRWAQAYEERQKALGHRPVRVPQRVHNNALRDRGRIVRCPRLPRREFERLKAYERLSPAQIRTARRADQARQRAARLTELRRRRDTALADTRQHAAAQIRAVTDAIRATERRLERQGFFYRLIRKVTRADARDFRRLQSLLDQREELVRSHNRRARETRLAALAEARSLKRIHRAQRQHDEEHIADRRRRSRAGRAGEAGRKVFNARARTDAVNPSEALRKRLEGDFDAAARSERPERGEQTPEPRESSARDNSRDPAAGPTREKRKRKPRPRNRDRGYER